MKGSFWNSGGFRDTAKHLVVSETIRDFKLDFFAILETGRDNFAAPFLKNLAPGLILCGTLCLHKAGQGVS